MARTDRTKIECPIHLCHTFVTDSIETFVSAVPIKIRDIVVIPINLLDDGTAVVAYEVPKIRVEKVFLENWISGDKVYYNFDLVEFTKESSGDNTYSAGICIKGHLVLKQ